jgi:hypothetical protein
MGRSCRSRFGSTGPLVMGGGQGALGLRMSARDHLNDSEFENMMPGLLASFSKPGWLLALRGVVLLPSGFGIQAAALL